MHLKRLAPVCLFLFLSGSNLLAQDPLKSQILRASLIEGDVTYWRSDLDQWTNLGVNVPVLEGDKIWVGRDGRAEIEFENGSTIRLAQNSGIDLARLGRFEDSGEVEIQLSGGLASFQLVSEGPVGVTAPLFSARAFKAAAFRTEVDADGSGRLVVFEGALEIESQQNKLVLSKGETLQLLSSDPDRYYLGIDYEFDEWDKWNSERDNYLAELRRNTNIPQDSGWNVAELGQHGSWYSVPDYGTVWRPHEDSDWVPFSSGRWTWYDSLGWTWVSFEPWGWTPYHYGRWTHLANHGWCWVPGTSSPWCPGAVSWVQGPGWVAWMPLAPFEPWSRWGNSGGGILMSANLRYGGPICYLPNDRFLNGSSVPQFSNSRQLLASGRVVSGQPSLAPTMASRIPVADANANRKFTNDDLEARRTLRDSMIRSTVPANSLTENLGQGGGATRPSGSGSNIRVIQGGSRMQTPSPSPSSDVRTYTNGNSGRQSLRPDQLRQADSRSVSGSPAVAPPRSPSVPSSEGPTTRERVYRIYGSQSESAKSNGSPASPPRDIAAPRNANAVPYNPPSRNTSVVPSAPQSRFQTTPESPSVPRSTTGASNPVQTPRSTPSSTVGQSSTGASTQESRSAARGRTSR
jgi:FecR protein